MPPSLGSYAYWEATCITSTTQIVNHRDHGVFSYAPSFWSDTVFPSSHIWKSNFRHCRLMGKWPVG